MRQLLTERYRERLAGVLSCYDRIIVTGTLPGACYAKGMMGFLSARQIRVFDYPRFAEPLRDRVRDRAAELASAAGVTIEHIAKKHIRKEDVVAKILAVRGDHPGQPRPVNGRNLKGLNFFSRGEQSLLAALQRPGFNIAGLRRADLLPLLGQSSSATLSRQLARLRHLGVIKRVLGTYRYHLTRAGRAAIASGRRLTDHTIIPALA